MTNRCGWAQILLSVQHEAGVHIEEIQADIFAQVILPALKGMPADDQDGSHPQSQRQFRGGWPGSRHRPDGPQAHGGYLRAVCKPGRWGIVGKDPTKIDRTAAYMARYIAKNIVAASIADRCRVALTYAIGMAKPWRLRWTPSKRVSVAMMNIWQQQYAMCSI